MHPCLPTKILKSPVDQWVLLFVQPRNSRAPGIDVLVIFDADSRHHSKRATIERIGNRERTRIISQQKRGHLASILQSNEVTPAITIQINNLQKDIQKLEKQANRSLPSNFKSEVIRLLQTFDDGGRGAVSTFTAPFQPDTEISKLAIDGDIDIVISGDSDFQMYIGPAGSGDLMIRNPKLTGKGNIDNIIFVTGQAEDRMSKVPSYGWTVHSARGKIEFTLLLQARLGRGRKDRPPLPATDQPTERHSNILFIIHVLPFCLLALLA
jgi:hypothetical protein